MRGYNINPSVTYIEIQQQRTVTMHMHINYGPPFGPGPKDHSLCAYLPFTHRSLWAYGPTAQYGLT